MLVRRGQALGAAALAALATPALAYRFAIVYRTRAGYPRRVPPSLTPADRGMPFEDTVVPSAAGALPAWFIPARDGAPGPGVVLVHGWESNRDRTLPNAQVLHAAGFHVLTFDIRGHGANPAETLPISVGEFRDDAAAGLATLLARPEVTSGAFLGHSLGAVGADLAAAEAGSRCAALVSTSAPSDPRRLTRQTFRLARLPLPEPLATPLAALTSRVYVQPRGHRVAELDASRALARYAGPILLVHGSDDSVVPAWHLDLLARAAEAGRRERTAKGLDAGGPIERLLLPGGRHWWMYEDPTYRATIARFLSSALGGPFEPDDAAARAVAVDARRIPEPDESFAAVTYAPTRRRTVAELIGARRAAPIRVPDAPVSTDGVTVG